MPDVPRSSRPLTARGGIRAQTKSRKVGRNWWTKRWMSVLENFYMGAELQRRVLILFHYALRPEGLLLLGTSETVGVSTDLFRAVDGFDWRRGLLFRGQQEPSQCMKRLRERSDENWSSRDWPEEALTHRSTGRRRHTVDMPSSEFRFADVDAFAQILGCPGR